MISKKTLRLLENLPNLILDMKINNDFAVNIKLVKEYVMRLHRREFKETVDVLKELEDKATIQEAKNELRLVRRFMEEVNYSDKRMVYLEEELERLTQLAREKHTLVSELNQIEEDLKMFFEESTKHIHELFLYETKIGLKNEIIKTRISAAVKQLLDDITQEIGMYYSELDMVNKVLPSDSIRSTMRKIAELRLQNIKLKQHIG